MGFRFRKSIKIAPGVRINLTKKGVSSVSVGKRGATVNVGKKGTRGTVGIPGSGLYYSSYKSHNQSKSTPNNSSQQTPISNNTPSPILPHSSSIHDIGSNQRQVSIVLGIGIFFIPFLFAWFTIRQGYSTVSRAISMVWMIVYIFAMR